MAPAAVTARKHTMDSMPLGRGESHCVALPYPETVQLASQEAHLTPEEVVGNGGPIRDTDGRVGWRTTFQQSYQCRRCGKGVLTRGCVAHDGVTSSNGVSVTVKYVTRLVNYITANCVYEVRHKYSNSEGNAGQTELVWRPTTTRWCVAPIG